MLFIMTVVDTTLIGNVCGNIYDDAAVKRREVVGLVYRTTSTVKKSCINKV